MTLSMRTSLPGCGFSMNLGGEWRVSDGWSDAPLQRLHGVYFRHGDGLQIHVVKHVGVVPRSIDDLKALLGQQNWASAPYDEVVVEGDPTMASALFKMLPRDIVLEGFVTNGR
jgi:hypothetical protein